MQLLPDMHVNEKIHGIHECACEIAIHEYLRVNERSAAMRTHVMRFFAAKHMHLTDAVLNYHCNELPLQSLDVIATRLFFDRHVSTKYPANVLSGFEPAAGGTFFNLNDLQVRD